MGNMLFQGAKVAICLNVVLHQHSRLKRGGRGVTKGCSLAPYLFILVGEVFKYIIKIAKIHGGIKGIMLP
jgi:hypothetical protein